MSSILDVADLTTLVIVVVNGNEWVVSLIYTFRRTERQLAVPLKRQREETGECERVIVENGRLPVSYETFHVSCFQT